jgi:homoserine kinase type II
VENSGFHQETFLNGGFTFFGHGAGRLSRQTGWVEKVITDHYDIGLLTEAELIGKGEINISYKVKAIEAGQHRRYVLRRYRDGTTLARVMFEHSLLSELEQKGFEFAHIVIPTKAGNSFADLGLSSTDRSETPVFVALLSYLEGEENYNWDSPRCIDSELIDAGRILSIYHQTIFGWSPPNEWIEPDTYEMLRRMTQSWMEFECAGERTVFDEYFLDSRAITLKMAANLLRSIPRESFNALPRLAIHGDYHPGNLKFLKGRVVGVFDFNWANMDARCLDVALALCYFCSIWEGLNRGQLSLDKMMLFLDAYQESYANAAESGSLGDLKEQELAMLPDLIQVAILSILDWTVSTYYSKRPDPVEYCRYLQQGIQSAKWAEEQGPALGNLVSRYRGV